MLLGLARPKKGTMKDEDRDEKSFLIEQVGRDVLVMRAQYEVQWACTSREKI